MEGFDEHSPIEDHANPRSDAIGRRSMVEDLFTSRSFQQDVQESQPYSRLSVQHPAQARTTDFASDWSGDSPPAHKPEQPHVGNHSHWACLGAQIAESRAAQVPEVDRGTTGVTTAESNTDSSIYDMEVILAYQHMPFELRAAEEAAATAQAGAGAIIADDDAAMTDAGYESDGHTTASTSITPSIWDHAFENGRRYHKFREGAYHFPNDDVEQEREDMKHSMVRMLCNHRLHFAPVDHNLQEILDIGTGTGTWAIESESYPSASVLGIDLSPIQPDWVPPNVRFIVDDVESPWLHPRNHFDYIHSRHTVMAIKDWGTLLQRFYEHTKPGGWVELQEIHHFPMSNNHRGGWMPPDHPVAQYWQFVNEGLAKLGVDLSGRLFASSPAAASASAAGPAVGGGMEPSMMELMRRHGFTNINQRVFHVPIGTWPQNKMLKSVGVYWRTILLDGLQAIALRPLMRGLEWNRDEVETFLVSVRKAYQDNSCQMFMPFVCMYSQKPPSAY